MRVSALGLISALSLFWPVSGADQRWVHISSTDFEIFSSAGEGNTREILQHFERVRSFFEQAMGASPAKLDPVRIIMFGSKKEFDPYRLNDAAVAYYRQVGGRDYIVLGSTSAEIFSIVNHEYFHLIARHAGLNLPPWLNEGLAEVYSTLKPLGDKAVVGTVIPSRLQALAFEKAIPLATLLAVDHDSPYYNETTKAGTFYDESWALTHMLQLSPAYNPKFIKVIDAIRAGTPSVQALETVYGKTLKEIENDLLSYGHGSRFRSAIFPIKIAQSTQRASAESAPLFDLKLALLDLTNHAGSEETRTKLEELAREDPKRPDPYVRLGYLAMRDPQMEDARKYFAKSLELGGGNPTMLWDYGRISAQAAPDESIHALGLLLKAEPGRTDVRLVLAQVQANSKQWNAALDTLRPIRIVSEMEAPTYFRQMAFANLNLGNSEEARTAGQQWARHAKDPADRENAERFEKYVGRANAAVSNPTSAGTSIASPTSEPAQPFAESVSTTALNANSTLPGPIEPDKATFQSDANFISVAVQVLTGKKSAIGLKREDFEIRDNGRLQTISSFGSEDQPLDLMLLLDYSRSTQRIETRVKNTAVEAMSKLRSTDRVGVVVFDTKTRLIAPLNSNYERVGDSIRAIPWYGNDTELNGTLLDTVVYLRQHARPEAHRHIIVLTDNSGDRAVSNEIVRNALWESNTVVSLIRFDTLDQSYMHELIHADLRQFVTATGGDLLDDNSKGTGLVEMFERLHERYVILYRAPEDEPGNLHQIKVDLTGKAKSGLGNVQVHARTGYLEGQANSDGRSKLLR